MNTRFQIRNIKEVQDFLKQLPRGTLRDGLRAFSKFILGNTSHGLRHSESYRFVSRARAYGKPSSAPAGYFSWKQFRFVAAITEGFTKPYQRTGETSAAWEMQETNGGYGYTFKNPKPAAYYLRDESGQARQPALVGWRKVSRVLQDNMAGAMRSAMAAVKKWIADNKPRG